MQSNWITTGPKVKLLEQEMLKLTQSKAAICVNSWTSGAMLMLKWFGVKEGDEVIVPAYTYCATALSVLHCGARPVMVDVLDDLTIDPEKVKEAINPRTKAIIAVDIAGLPCNYQELNGIIKDPQIQKMFVAEHENQGILGRILLISDAAHSIGATIDNRPAALKSDIAIYSFHAVKNITTAEGGCVCLNLPQVFNPEAEYQFLKVFSLNGQNKDAFNKNNGGGWKYDVLYAGLKINMPDISAAIGLAQIRQYLQVLYPLRKLVAFKYLKALKKFSWFTPPVLADSVRETSYHIFPVRIKNITEAQRDRIIEQIMEKGVVVNVHFIPLPMLAVFKNLGYSIEDYPNAYRQYACEISLPIYPQLTAGETDYVISTLIDAVHQEIKAVDLSHPVRSMVKL